MSNLRQIMIDAQGRRQLSQLEVDELVNEIDRLRAGISVSTRVLVQSEWHYPAWVMELMGDDLRRSI